MAKILIIYYSRSGNTQKMAEYVAGGIKVEGDMDLEVKKVQDTKVEDLVRADGIIIGSPTYYGSMAWEIKKLIDESVKYHGQLAGKVGGAFSSAANIAGGNETTIMDIIDAMLIHGMVVQGEAQGDHYGPVSIGTPADRSKKGCEKLGRNVARLVKKLA